MRISDWSSDVCSSDLFAADLLAGPPYEIVHVIGHSDRIGNADANVALSTRRANSVRDYLLEKGVPADRITAVGRGSVEPVVECEDQDRDARSEEHTSKLQSPMRISYDVFCLKKKKKIYN